MTMSENAQVTPVTRVEIEQQGDEHPREGILHPAGTHSWRLTDLDAVPWVDHGD